MKRRFISLLLVLLASLLPCAAWAATTTGQFKDITGQWWAQSIEECNAANIVGGRSASIFAPKDPVTRLEAVIMLNRALGHRNEADNYDMAPGGYNFPADFPEWGKRNVAFAADKGYISKAGIPNMDPKHAASRAEIAVLFANALKLSADGYELNFTDKSAIPASMQPYVAAAVKYGIMVGKAGNKFDPNANVTRGEMAAIIARLFENGQINPQPDRYFIAKVSAVDAAKKTIAVVKGGQTATYNLATTSVIYRSGSKANLTSFKTGENVKLVLDTTGKVIFVAYTTASPSNNSSNPVTTTTTYTGTILSLNLANQLTLSFQPDNGSQNSYPLASSVKITQNGLTKDLTALNPGTRAEIKVIDGSVAEINLLANAATGNQIKGYVVNVFLDGITVHYDDGTSERLDKWANGVNFYGLTRGQRIALTKDGDMVTSLTTLSETPKVFGSVVSLGSSSISYEDDDGYERSLDLASNYRLKDKDGDSINQEDVEDGDSIEIELNSQGQAVTIKLTDSTSSSSSDLEGEVTYIKTSGDYRLTIKKQDGSEKTYDVNNDVYVTQNGKDRDFEDINEQDYVKLDVDGNDNVTDIEILDVEVIEGEVTNIETYGKQSITIKNSSGKEKDYDVASNVRVWEDGSSRNFRNIHSGDQVRLLINDDDDEVFVINILDESSSSGTYAGTIYELDLDEDKLVLEDDGKRTTYNLDNDVEVEKDSDNIDPEDIIIGSEAEITVKDSKVTRIEITDDENIKIKGKLYRVSGVRITIEQENGTSSGTRHTFITKEKVSIKDPDGDSISLSKLKDNYIGDDVVIELDDGEIDSLEVLD